MAELLAAFHEQSSDRPSQGQGSQSAPSWLHLQEELPDWLHLIFNENSARIRGLSASQQDTLRRALAIEQQAAASFNFRTSDSGQYRERSQAITANFDDDLRSLVLKLADRLGLVSPSPTRFEDYKNTLIMGGGYRSPLLRTRYSALLQDTGIGLGELSFLGSPRFLIEEPAERPETDKYAPGAVDEFDLMRGAAHSEFGLLSSEIEFLCGCSSTSVICPRWRHGGKDGADRTPPAYTHERRANLIDAGGQRRGSALSASTSRPPYRPHTADTFALWARCSDPQPDQHTLVVTTQVFVPFQMFDAIRQLYLSHGIDINAVGFGADWGDRPQTAEYLLQETLSAIRSGRRLLVDAAEMLMGPTTVV